MWDLSDPKDPIRREAKKTLRLLDVPHAASDIRSLARSIYELTSEFDNMASSIFTELRSSHDKWPPDNLPVDRKSRAQDKRQPKP